MITMNKGAHFLGQPMCGQLISLLDKAQILRISQENKKRPLRNGLNIGLYYPYRRAVVVAR